MDHFEFYNDAPSYNDEALVIECLMMSAQINDWS